MKKKIITGLLLLLVLLLSIVVVEAKGTPTALPDREKEIKANFTGQENSAHSMTDGDVVGIHFHIAGDATFVGISCPSWNDDIGNLTLSLFAFEKDYETSVSKDPLYRYEFEDFEDNAFLGFEFPESDPLKAGQYVFELSDPYDTKSSVGLWTCFQYPGQHFYENGKYNKFLSARMLVEFKGEEPEVPYVALPDKEVERGETYDGPEPFLGALVRFSDREAEYYVSRNHFHDIDDYYIEDEKLVVLVPVSEDPYFAINLSYFEVVPTEVYPIMLIRIKREEGTHKVGEIFFNTTDSPGPKGGSSVKFQYQDTTEWQNVIIDLSSNRRYTGDLLDFRLDIVDKSYIDSTFLIDYILFFGSEEAAQNFTIEDYEALPKSEVATEATEKPVRTSTLEKTPKKEEEKEVTKSKSVNYIWLYIIIGLVVVAVPVIVILILKRKR